MDEQQYEDIPKQKKIKKSSFENYGFIYQLFKALIYNKFHSPLPIQKKAIPPIMQGRDVIVASKTGSGKTLAYLLPLINKLKCHSTIVGARALILVPTRQLASQVASVLRDMARFTGGHATDGQFFKLTQNPDIIIATPGRLWELLQVKDSNFSLSRVQMVVFDEADNLVEQGFRAHMSAILDSCRISQKLLFSATVPQQLNQLTQLKLRDYVFIQQEITLPQKMVLDFLIVRNQAKLALLINLLTKRSSKKAIVFASTRYQVDLLQAILSKSFNQCIPIYGKMDMIERNQAIAQFRSCKKGILVVTDLASRGLDIPEVGLVIHFDYPSSHKIFVHRSGRTARKEEAGQTIALINFTQLSYMVQLCYVVGRKLVTDLEQKKDVAYYGTVPNSFFQDQQGIVRDALKKDDQIKKLHQVSEKAMEKFRKFRTPASSYSIKLSKELEVGLHPKFKSMDDQQLQFIGRIKNYNPQRSFLELQRISQDKDETSDPFLLAVNKIRMQQNYKNQTKAKQSERKQKRQQQIQELVKFNKQEEHKLKQYRQKRNKDKPPVVLPDVDIQYGSNKLKKSHVKDFKNQSQYISDIRIPGVASQFDNLQKINVNQLDQNLNDEGNIKNRPKRIWDSKSKTFKFKKDQEDKYSKDQKAKKAFVKWKKTTHLSIQKVGQIEDQKNVKAAKKYWQQKRKFAKGWKQNKQGRSNDQSYRKGESMRKRIKKKRIASSSSSKRGGKSNPRAGNRSGSRGGARGSFKGGSKGGKRK